MPFWTLPQRRAISVVLATAILLLAWRAWRSPATVPDPLPDVAPLQDQLADRLDPNTADLAALSMLPRLGEKHAAAIVEFREEYQRLHPGHRAFDRPEDLALVRGIGIATVHNLAPYLRFDDSKP